MPVSYLNLGDYYNSLHCRAAVIPITLVKSCCVIFDDLLSKLANLSFTETISPDQFKLGQVTPIPKNLGLAVDDPSNYRSKTNLCTFGKVLEKLAQNQLRNHINASPNIAPLQSAYRAFHSMKTAMTKVVSDLQHLVLSVI